MGPLDFWFIHIVNDGINKAARAYGIPIEYHDRLINTYAYGSTIPRELPAGEAYQCPEKTIDLLARRWDSEWLPEIQEQLAFWENFDLEGCNDDDLLTHLAATEQRLHRVWEIHFLLFIPMMLAISRYEDLFNAVIGTEAGFDAYDLLAGFDTKTLESGRLLWRLSRKAEPEVRELFATADPASIFEKLEALPAAAKFLAGLREYLELHGHRGDKLLISYPFWIEDPTPVITGIRDHINQPLKDMDAELAATAATRERHINTAREILRNHPASTRERFDDYLANAQLSYRLKEDHGYWIDYKTSYQVRRVMLEFGGRLANRKSIARRDDVFLLKHEEILRLKTSPDLAEAINDRRKAMDRYSIVTAPELLGTPSNEPPPDDPVSAMFMKMEGEPPPSAATDKEIYGTAASKGVVRGTARILKTVADSPRLNPGEILVAETALPAWEPLFAKAAAIVTDTGGRLCHCALLAREHGLPTVVGTGSATRQIKDGAKIEVDGGAGIVRILSN